jgi:hypothetical protein
MKTILALCAVLGAGLHAAQIPAPYTAVEVDRFVPQRGIAVPPAFQSALADDTAREISLAFPTVLMVRQGQPAPYRHALLRISGVITRFKSGTRATRYLLGFGAGDAFAEAQIWFVDGMTGRVLLNRRVKGATRIEVAGSDSQAGDSLDKKIAKLCNATHLVASNWQGRLGLPRSPCFDYLGGK